MIAREWKTICPKETKESFLIYLYDTGIKDAISISGYIGYKVFVRKIENNYEIKLITFWDSLDSIVKYAGDNITTARLYENDYKYKIIPDDFVTHYEVIENLENNEHKAVYETVNEQ